MEKTLKLIESSDLFNKINGLALPRSERLKAADALETSDKVADAVYTLVTKAKQIFAWLNPQPKFKAE